MCLGLGETAATKQYTQADSTAAFGVKKGPESSRCDSSLIETGEFWVWAWSGGKWIGTS